MLPVAAEDFRLLLFVVVWIVIFYFCIFFCTVLPRVFRYNQLFLSIHGSFLLILCRFLLVFCSSFSYIHTPGCFADTTGNKSNYNRDEDVVLFVILWLFVLSYLIMQLLRWLKREVTYSWKVDVNIKLIFFSTRFFFVHARADTSVLDFQHSIHTYPLLLAIPARMAVAGRSRVVFGPCLIHHSSL